VRGRAFALLAAALLGVGVARLVALPSVFSPTVDQHIHLLSGLEWWDRGRYELEPLHPPLSRVLLAALPYGAAGLRLPPEVREFRCPTLARSLERLRPNGKRFACMSRIPLDVDAFFTSRGDYERLFRLAGLGTLPLFLRAGLATLLWALALPGYDRPTALLALLLFTTLPAVLGHAGVATTDMAPAATLPLALLAAFWYLGSPSPWRAAGWGAATGLALLSKFSVLLFLPPALLVLALVHWRSGREAPLARAWRGLPLALLSALFLVWAGYRFDVAAPQDVVPHLSGGGWAAWPLVPAPDFVAGLHDALKKESAGHAYFVLGRALEREGVWYFFPVALLFKTPLAFLAAVGLGVAAARRAPLPLLAALPLLLAAALLGAAMTVDVNVGIRHVLAVYPFLCLGAALGLRRLLAASRPAQAAAVLLVAGHLASGIRAHPDYLAYFNALARGRPEEVLVDSDLDWGQDVKRLARAAQARGIREITTCRAGAVPLAVYAPEVREERACPSQPVAGWLAVGLSDLKAFHADALGWLARERPVARIGSSMLLYHVASRPGAR
jgi:4-amino-4-deoxy-L-arabinose transferase-like glycosyltransferase